MTEKETSNLINQDEINIKEILFKYLRYWYYFVAATLITFTSAYLYNRYSTSIYQMDSSVLVKEGSSGGANDLLKELDLFQSSRNVENEIQLLKSRALVSKAIENLPLSISYTLIGDVKNKELYTKSPITLVYDTSGILAKSGITFNITIIDTSVYELTVNLNEDEKIEKKQYAFSEKAYCLDEEIQIKKNQNFHRWLRSSVSGNREILLRFHSTEELIPYYMSLLKVNVAALKSSVLTLTFTDAVPERGVDFLNKLMQVYIENAIEQKNELASNSLKFIEEQLKYVSDDLKETEVAIENYKTDRGITDISAEAEAFLDNVKIFDAKISEADIQISFLNYLEKYVNDDKKLNDFSPTTMGLNDPLLQSQLARLGSLQNEKEKYINTTKGENPVVISIDNQIKASKSSLLESIKSIREGVKVTKQEAQRHLTSIEGKIKNIPRTERELVGYQRQYSTEETLYLYLLQKKAETAIILASTVPDNRIIDSAHTDLRPIKPVKSLSYIIAFALGILVPIVFIFVRDSLKDTISDLATLKQVTDIPLLGLVTVKDNKVSNLIVVDRPKSNISEAFRSIRTNLQFFLNAQEKKNVILITSSIGSEGKSFCSLNLASVFALSGKKTVLIGMDLRKPKLTEDFGFVNDIGISNYLIGAANENEIIKKTEINPLLDVILSGPIPPNPAELILSNKMNELFEYLIKNYDYVIVDTPPITLVTDGVILTKYANAMIYVVRENYTKKSHLDYVNQLYKERKIKNIGIIFNAVNTGMGKYGYGYGYGYYSDDITEKRTTFQKIVSIFSRKG